MGTGVFHPSPCLCQYSMSSSCHQQRGEKHRRGDSGPAVPDHVTLGARVPSCRSGPGCGREEARGERAGDAPSGRQQRELPGPRPFVCLVRRPLRQPAERTAQSSALRVPRVCVCGGEAPPLATGTVRVSTTFCCSGSLSGHPRHCRLLPGGAARQALAARARSPAPGWRGPHPCAAATGGKGGHGGRAGPRGDEALSPPP